MPAYDERFASMGLSQNEFDTVARTFRNIYVEHKATSEGKCLAWLGTLCVCICIICVSFPRPIFYHNAQQDLASAPGPALIFVLHTFHFHCWRDDKANWMLDSHPPWLHPVTQ